MKKTILFFLFLFLTISLVSAQVKLNFKDVESPDVPVNNFIGNLYTIGLVLGGFIVFGMLVVGGFLYISSGAIPANKKNALQIIFNALGGFALLLGAYTILININPQLIQLKNPGEEVLSPIEYEECRPPQKQEGGGGIQVTPKLPFCELYQYPRDPNTGKCVCYITDQWVAEYDQSFESSEGGDFSNFTCSQEQKLTGKAAAQAIVGTGKNYLGKITYSNADSRCSLPRDRPDLGSADCSGYTYYLYKCVMGVSLGNSGYLKDASLPESLERFTGTDKEKKAKVGDLIGLDNVCKNGKFGHVMIVVEKSGDEITKIMDVGGKSCNPKGGGAHWRVMSSKMETAWKNCGYVIHIKGND